MKIVVAMDSFKGTLSATEACRIVSEAASSVLPDARIQVKPMADGGEGTAKAMIVARNGQWIPQKVMGPLPDMKIEAGFAWFEDTRTALVEMACASGIELLEPKQLNPLKTTTYGTGQLIKAAAERQPCEILLAVGGSATVDAGVGAAMALGWEFIDELGQEIGLGGGEIEKIRDIIPPSDPLNCSVKVLCDVDNPLCGPTGAAEVFGPQKGADPEMVKQLDDAIGRLSDLVKEKTQIDVAWIPGAGAAGGLAGGSMAFMGADPVSGIDTIIEASSLEEAMHDADWVITGEGSFDHQSLMGKVVHGISRIARKTDAKLFVIAGQVSVSEEECKEHGIAAALSSRKEGMTLSHALENSPSLLGEAAKELCRHAAEYL